MLSLKTESLLTTIVTAEKIAPVKKSALVAHYAKVMMAEHGHQSTVVNKRSSTTHSEFTTKTSQRDWSAYL